MSTADLVIFRRSRGLFWGGLCTTVIFLPVLFTAAVVIPSWLEWYSEETIAGIGGPTEVAVNSIGMVSLLGAIAAILLGATAGSVDLQRGVLRDLVVAGRPRWRIVIGRLAAAAVMLLGGLIVAVAAIVALSVGFAPGEGSLDTGEVGRTVASLIPWLYSALAFGAGIAMLIGSRGPAIGIYFAFMFIVEPVFFFVPKLTDAWGHISYALAQTQVMSWIAGDPIDPDAVNSNVVAAIVLACWGVIPFVAGVVRLSKRDL